MASRYDSRITAINDNELYKSMFQERGVKFIKQYDFPNLRYPTVEEIRELNIIGKTWALGDRYYKLAHQYYGRSDLWWIIAWYNKKPTEFHIEIGETIYIPLPLEKILDFLDI